MAYHAGKRAGVSLTASADFVSLIGSAGFVSLIESADFTTRLSLLRPADDQAPPSPAVSHILCLVFR